VTPTPLARLANPLVWLGGGSWRDIDEPAERSTYQTAGFFVALHALLAGCVVAFVVRLAGAGEPASWVFGVASGLLVGAVGRVLATAPAEPNRGRSSWCWASSPGRWSPCCSAWSSASWPRWPFSPVRSTAS
jgi:hypothetical protein